jgi:hypothetical protein
MKLLEGFNLFFNPAFAIEKLFTLWGGGGGKGGDTPDYIPIKPANVTTGFGTGRADPEKGIYKYTLDPRLAQMRDIFYGATSQFMPTMAENQFAQGVSQTGVDTFGRGNEFLNQALGLDTAQLGQDYYNQIQNLMSMDRAQEEARLADTLFKTGRTGVGVGTQGGYINPEQFALLKAREQANQQLAINANQYGRAQREGDIGFASRLMGTGLSTYGAGKQTQATPYQTMAGIFGLGTGIEGLGFNANLGTAMQAINAQLSQQQRAQEYENAKAASGGGKGGLGGLVQTGLDIYSATQGMPELGSSIGSIWSGSSPSSGLGSIFGSTGGWGGSLGVWDPISTNIGMGGVSGPANFGGGTIAPRF